MKSKKINILLATLIVCAGIAGGVAFTHQSPVQTAPAAVSPGRGQPAPVNDALVREKTGEAAESKEPGDLREPANTAVIRFLCAQQEGIIGTYAGKQLDNPSDNLFTVKIDQTLSNNDKAWLSYELSGVADYTNVPKSINDRPATGGYLVKLSDKPSRQREQLNVYWLKKGDNRIQFSLPENAEYGYKVSNLSIEVEKGANQSPLAVNSTSTSFDNKAYISGYIQDGNARQTEFYIDGKPVTAVAGAFEAVVPLTGSRKVEVKAVLANGKELTQQVSFTTGTNLDIEYAMNNNTKEASKTFKKGIAEDLKLETALLNVDSKALLATKDISITTLRHIDMAALDMGMNNVTATHKGYRFLPHGEHFAQGATVTIKYDRTKIPDGFTEDDIRTYYFDRSSYCSIKFLRVSFKPNISTSFYFGIKLVSCIYSRIA